MVVLDTNIIIDHLRLKGESASVLEKLIQKLGSNKLSYSLISLQELYEGKSIAEKKREDFLIETIAHLNVEPYSYEVARIAGEIAREINIEFPDAAIAATAITNGAALATLNPKDFAGISRLEIFKI